MPKNKFETVQGLAGVSIEIGVILTRETIKNTALASRFVARRGIRVLHSSVELATQATDRYGLGKRREEYVEGSIQQAMGEAILAVVDAAPKEVVSEKLDVFATKLAGAHELLNEVRIIRPDPDIPDIIIPTDTIKDRYIEEFGTAVWELGIHPDDVLHFQAGVRERAGMEPDGQDASGLWLGAVPSLSLIPRLV